MTKNVTMAAKAAASIEAKRIYFVLDVDAVLRNMKNPVKVLLLTETDCRDMISYYGGELEAYTDYKSAKEAISWYRAN